MRKQNDHFFISHVHDENDEFETPPASPGRDDESTTSKTSNFVNTVASRGSTTFQEAVVSEKVVVILPLGGKTCSKLTNCVDANNIAKSYESRSHYA